MITPSITVTPDVANHLPTDAGKAFINSRVEQARLRQWGSVSASEAATNTTADTATGAYPIPDDLGGDVVMIDVTNVGSSRETITVRLLGQKTSPAAINQAPALAEGGTLRVRLISSDSPYGFDILSHYVEQFWTPILGPTSMLLLRNIARIPLQIDATTHAPLELELLSQMLGLHFKGGRNSSIMRTIERLIRFDMFILESGAGTNVSVAVPNRIPQVAVHRRTRWSEVMQAGHDMAVNAHLEHIARQGTATS